MSMFSNMTTEGMEESKDTLGGYQPLDSDIYLAKIKTAYITISKNNAMAVNFVADIEGREYREQLWITNSKGENARKHESGTVFLAKWNDCRSS